MTRTSIIVSNSFSGRLLEWQDAVAGTPELGLTPATVRHYCDTSRIGYITWRWRHGIIARARRYVPKAAVLEFLEHRVVRGNRQHSTIT